MTAPSLEGRLLCASNLAYAIVDSGPVPASPPYDGGTGLLPGATGFASGANRIDAALVGTSPTDGVVLAFRGTLPPGPERPPEQVLKDWLNDADIALVDGAPLPGRVHQGFFGALEALWPLVAPEVQRQLAASPVKRLCVTGHSKGGSIAHLAAARFAVLGLVRGSDILVRSFEGAQPGNQAFADAYEGMVADAVRYEYTDDLVPHLPPSLRMRRQLQSLEAFKTLAAIDARFDYAPAGTLRFIDWSGDIRGSSLLLDAERFVHLAELLALGKVEEIVRDHAIGCGSGVMQVICPTGVCP